MKIDMSVKNIYNRFSKYEFYNKLLGGVTLLKVTLGVNFNSIHIYIYIYILSSTSNSLQKSELTDPNPKSEVKKGRGTYGNT